MSTFKFIINRVLWSVFVLVGLSMLIFFIARIIPGDPAILALGSTASEQALDLYREENHLNESIPVQYFYWLKDAVKGDLGDSAQTKRPVSQDIAEYLPATLELIFFAAIFEIFFGIMFGVLSARRSGGVIDNTVRVTSYLGIATPSFVWAILFMLLFCYVLHLLPTIGRLSSTLATPQHITGFYILDSLLTGNAVAAWDTFKHLIMPSVALSLAGIAQSARITRTSMLDNMSKDFVGAEISAGIPMRRVLMSYVLRPSATPTVAIISLDIAAMLGNAFLVEQIFSYPGISKYGMSSILTKDLNSIVGVVMIIGITFLLVNIVVDIIAAYLDPRIRLQGGAK